MLKSIECSERSFVHSVVNAEPTLELIQTVVSTSDYSVPSRSDSFESVSRDRPVFVTSYSSSSSLRFERGVFDRLRFSFRIAVSVRRSIPVLVLTPASGRHTAKPIQRQRGVCVSIYSGTEGCQTTSSIAMETLLKPYSGNTVSGRPRAPSGPTFLPDSGELTIQRHSGVTQLYSGTTGCGVVYTAETWGYTSTIQRH